MSEYDVLIVGARCAGSPLATLLARQGLRVCLLDRADFPSETPSTHVIQPSGVAVLAALGVLDDLTAAGAVAIAGLTMVSDDVRIEAATGGGALGRADGPGLCVRRVTLDGRLVEAAGRAGVHVRTGTRVTGLVHEAARVVGVRTDRETIRARLVVGADGRGSTVADHTGAGEYHVSPAGRVFTWAYYEGVASREGRLRIGRMGDLAYAASPTDGGLYMAAVCPSAEHKRAVLADREGSYDAGLRAWPELADLLAGGRRVGPVRVVHNWHGFFREASGPGWVLLGDAGHFKDPTPAQGISDALRHASRLAEVLGPVIGDASATDRALRRWWRWRDRDLYDMHWFAADMGASGELSPLLRRVLREISRDADASGDLLRLLNHEIASSRLLRPGVLARAITGEAKDHPREVARLAGDVVAELRAGVHRARLRRWPEVVHASPRAARV